MLDARRLAYFVAIVEQRSFRRAAQLTGVSQPALSIAIQKLEHELGAILLDRTNDGVFPTEAGTMLLDHARSALSREADFKARIADLRSLRGGAIALGISRSFSYDVIADVVASVVREHGVDCTIRTGHSFELFEMLESHDIDVFIGLTTPRAETAGCDSVYLFSDPFVVIVGAHHPLLRLPAAERQAAARGYRWLFNRSLADSAPEAGRFLEMFGDRQEGVDVTDRDMVKALLRTTDHLTVWPTLSFREELQRGELGALDIPRVGGQRWEAHFGIVKRSDRSLSFSAQHLVDRLKEAVGRQIEARNRSALAE